MNSRGISANTSKYETVLGGLLKSLEHRGHLKGGVPIMGIGRAI